MNLTGQDKALFITFGGACFLILVFFFLTINPFDKKNNEEAFIPIPVIEHIEEQEQVPKEEPKENTSDNTLTHTAQNRSRLQEEANRYFNEENREQNALEMQEQSQNNETLEYQSGEAVNYKEKIKELREKRAQITSQGNNTQKDKISQVNTSSSKRSTVSYILKERDAVRIPNPVYTCDATGRVVINITVNNLGQVVKTSYNNKASSTGNGCLVDQALQYAQRAKFNSSSRETQLGSITFLFQG